MATAVSDLVEAVASAREKAENAYAELVDRMEAGEEIPRHAALRILRDAGKDPAEIGAELARRRRVAELRNRIEAAGDTVERQIAIEQQLAMKKQEIEEVTKRLRDERVALERSLEALGRERLELEELRRELARLAPPPADEVERQNAMKEIRGQIGRLTVMVAGKLDSDAAQADLDRLDRSIAETMEHLDRLGPINVVNMFKVRSAKRKLSDLTKEKRDLALRVEKCRAFVHDWRRLKNLRSKLAALQPETAE